jgi:PIN domain nuclease of toxin-antitoxin system
MTYILDASAMVALIRREVGWDRVKDFLTRSGSVCCAHGMQLCKVYYSFLRASGAATARSAIDDLYAGGVTLREDLDTPFWQEASHISATYGVPLIDSFCVALARRLKGEVVTADHKDFDPIVPLSLCVVQFIR